MLCAFARSPARGIADSVYTAYQRGGPGASGGARPLLTTPRVPSPAARAALCAGVCERLAKIDAYGDPPPDPETFYRDARGTRVQARCPWSLAQVARPGIPPRPTAGRATCPIPDGSCACEPEDPPCEGPFVPDPPPDAHGFRTLPSAAS